MSDKLELFALFSFEDQNCGWMIDCLIGSCHFMKEALSQDICFGWLGIQNLFACFISSAAFSNIFSFSFFFCGTGKLRFLMKIGQRSKAAGVLVWVRTGRYQKTVSETDMKGVIGDELDEIAATLEESRHGGEVSWREIAQKENLKR